MNKMVFPCVQERPTDGTIQQLRHFSNFNLSYPHTHGSWWTLSSAEDILDYRHVW
jgi:hypothetical protein